MNIAEQLKWAKSTLDANQYQAEFWSKTQRLQQENEEKLIKHIYNQALRTGHVTLCNIFHPLHKISLLDRKKFAKATMKEYNQDLPSDYSVQGQKEADFDADASISISDLIEKHMD